MPFEVIQSVVISSLLVSLAVVLRRLKQAYEARPLWQKEEREAIRGALRALGMASALYRQEIVMLRQEQKVMEVKLAALIERSSEGRG